MQNWISSPARAPFSPTPADLKAAWRDGRRGVSAGSEARQACGGVRNRFQSVRAAVPEYGVPGRAARAWPFPVGVFFVFVLFFVQSWVMRLSLIHI